jgi:mono/diheme cytochrome c family protein
MVTLQRIKLATAFIAAASLQVAFAQAPKKDDSQAIERGRYLAKIAGCNDCHTPGYAQAGGKVPEKQWLTGDQLGWRGPWGTTYATNLRLYMQNFTEDQWVKLAKSRQLRPPMPWFALQDMTTQDLRAIYKFIRYLGPAGAPAPTFVLPGQEPKGPYVLFPQTPK